MSNKITDLKAQLKARISEQKEAMAIKALETKLNSPSYIESASKHMALEEASNFIKHCIEVCEKIITDTPIYNDKRKENRKWSGSAPLDNGVHYNLLVSLARGIQYSTKVHKREMLKEVPLSEDLIDRLVHNAGRYPMFDALSNSVMGSPTNVPNLQELVVFVEEAMDISLDINLDPAKEQRSFTTAWALAEQNQLQHQQMLKLMDEEF